MRRSIFFVFTVVIAAALAQLPAGPALAAPPANDTFGGAIAVTVGFSEDRDTSEATTDADDQSANQDCGAPATDASVWYALTVPAEMGVVVDVSESSYTAGVLVVSGTPGNFTLHQCGPGTVAFLASPGTVYYLLAIDDQFDGGGNGGILRISITEAPPPPEVGITVDPVGFVNQRTGEATLSGTFSCTNSDFLEVFGDLAQPVGRFTVRGFFGFFADGSVCDGTSRSWSALVTPENGKFAGGRAASVTFAFACGPFECAFGYVEQTVLLRGGRR